MYIKHFTFLIKATQAREFNLTDEKVMQHYNYMILSYWRRISCSLSGKRTSFSAAPSALSAPSVSVPRSCCQDFSWHFLLMAAKCLLLCKIAGVIRRWILGTLYFWVLPSFKGLGVLSCLVLGLLLRQRTALHFQQQLPKNGHCHYVFRERKVAADSTLPLCCLKASRGLALLRHPNYNVA